LSPPAQHIGSELPVASCCRRFLFREESVLISGELTGF
jgi:hypothetical protein